MTQPTVTQSDSSLISSHLSLNHEGRWGTTDDFATSFLHFSLFSTVLLGLTHSGPVHFLMLYSHLFLCPPCLFPPFTVPCKVVLARPDERETWPYHCSLRLFTMVRRSSCGLIACWISARTSLLITWSLYEMCTILRSHLISMTKQTKQKPLTHIQKARQSFDDKGASLVPQVDRH